MLSPAASDPAAATSCEVARSAFAAPGRPSWGWVAAAFLALALTPGLGRFASAQEAPTAPELAGAEREGRRMLGAEEAAAFRAVGRLNVAGTRFCTAALVSEREILTAAHCLFHPRTLQRVPLSEFRFVPGQRLEANLGVWRVARAAILPGFVIVAAPGTEDLRADIALLELTEPVPIDKAAAFPVAPFAPGETLAIVSYARDRAQAPSISPDCPALGVLGELLIVDCAVERGVSGAPVIAGKGAEARVVAVVAGMGSLPDGDAFALTALASPRIEALRADLAAQTEAQGEE